jgi:AraC-like DNA-binding protein
MVFIGPLMRQFLKSFFENSFKLRRIEIAELCFGAAIFLLTFISGEGFINFAYYLITAHLAVYLGICGMYLFQHRESFRTEDLKWKWASIVLIATNIIAVTFILQLLIYQPLVYKIIVSTAACIFYGLSLWAIPQSKLFLPESRKRSTESGYEDLSKKILSLLRDDELFADPNLTVTKLAGILKSPPYLVSRVINHSFGKGFSELLTQFRIQKSEKLLLQEGSKTLTIESIAFESGFNTLSSFYTSFKKINKVTPAQFRDSGDKARMKIA